MSEKDLNIGQFNSQLVNKAIVFSKEDGSRFVSIALNKEAYDWCMILFPSEVKYLLDNIHLEKLNRDMIDDGDVLECRTINNNLAIEFTLSHRANRQIISLDKNELKTMYDQIV